MSIVSPMFFLESAVSVMDWYRQKKRLDISYRNQTEDLMIYQSQKNLNNTTRAINMDRIVKYANQKAGMVRLSFAAAGLSGGTIESQIQSYTNSTMLNALLED